MWLRWLCCLLTGTPVYYLSQTLIFLRRISACSAVFLEFFHMYSGSRTRVARERRFDADYRTLCNICPRLHPTLCITLQNLYCTLTLIKSFFPGLETLPSLHATVHLFISVMVLVNISLLFMYLSAQRVSCLFLLYMTCPMSLCRVRG